MKEAWRRTSEGRSPEVGFGDAPPLTFGIYPGSVAGTESGLAVGPPDDPERIKEMLHELRGGAGRTFIVRGYVPFHDSTKNGAVTTCTPEDVEQYAGDGRRLDLVVQFQSKSGDVDGYVSFVREQVRRYGSLSDTIQITEEPNLTALPILDGAFPNVREALVQGVISAKDEACRLGYGHLKIGFNAVPTVNPQDDFWSAIGRFGRREFIESLDYIGLDFFPGVFRPVAPDEQLWDLKDMIAGVLKTLRESWMPAAGIPASAPIHITENGWPTGPDRPYEQQAVTLERIIRTVHECRGDYNVARYELFDLRDADSSNPDIFHQFGLLRDDYSPKPAFEVYRRLISELGSPTPRHECPS